MNATTLAIATGVVFASTAIPIRWATGAGPSKGQIEAWMHLTPASAGADRKRLSNDDVLIAINDDLTEFNSNGKNDTRNIRYLTIQNAYNHWLRDDDYSKLSEIDRETWFAARLQTYYRGIAHGLNLVSRGKEVAVPVVVGSAGGAVLRVDLSEFSWTASDWNEVVQDYPYGVVLDTEPGKSICRQTSTSVPIARGDWFVWRVLQPDLYYELLNLPSTQQDLLSQLGVSNAAVSHAIRTGFAESNVSPNNRVLERRQTAKGLPVWISYDFARSDGVGDIFTHPLGPGIEDNAFQPDAHEIIFPLENGMQGFYVADRLGHRLEQAPVNVVSDFMHSTNLGPFIRPAISCVMCHTDGLRSSTYRHDDQVLRHVNSVGAGVFPDDDIKAIDLLYKDAKVISDAVESDLKMRAGVFAQMGTNANPESFSLELKRSDSTPTAAYYSIYPIEEVIRSYISVLDFAEVADETGVESAYLESKIGTLSDLSRELPRITASDQTIDGGGQTVRGAIKREVFAQVYPDLIEQLQVGHSQRPSTSFRKLAVSFWVLLTAAAAVGFVRTRMKSYQSID